MAVQYTHRLPAAESDIHSKLLKMQGFAIILETL